MELKHISVRPRNPFQGWQRRLHAAALMAFIAALLLVWGRVCLAHPMFETSRWPEGLLLLLAAATTLASLSRQLPAQTVVLAASIVGILGGAVQAFGAATGIPFGPLVYNQENVGLFLFSALPWYIPLVWVIIILNSRGVARLILRFRRGRPNYGLWVMALTVVLVLLFQLSFEPYATHVKEYWSWKPTKIRSDWYSTPWVNFLGWAVSVLLILLFVTPALIRKHPVPIPPAYHPLLMWETLNGLFLTGTVMHHLWAATALTISHMMLVAIFAWLGNESSQKKSPEPKIHAAAL